MWGPSVFRSNRWDSLVQESVWLIEERGTDDTVETLRTVDQRDVPKEVRGRLIPYLCWYSEKRRIRRHRGVMGILLNRRKTTEYVDKCRTRTDGNPSEVGEGGHKVEKTGSLKLAESDLIRGKGQGLGKVSSETSLGKSGIFTSSLQWGGSAKDLELKNGLTA